MLLLVGSVVALVGAIAVAAFGAYRFWDTAIMPATTPLQTFRTNETIEFTPPNVENAFIIARNVSASVVQLDEESDINASITFTNTGDDGSGYLASVARPDGTPLVTTDSNFFINRNEVRYEAFAEFSPASVEPLTISVASNVDTELVILPDAAELIATAVTKTLPIWVASLGLLAAFFILLIVGIVQLSNRPSRLERELDGIG